MPNQADTMEGHLISKRMATKLKKKSEPVVVHISI